MTYLTAWRKGDLVRLPNGDEFRLTSDGYEKRPYPYCQTFESWELTLKWALNLFITKMVGFTLMGQHGQNNVWNIKNRNSARDK
jgi:hypothetical protein